MSTRNIYNICFSTGAFPNSFKTVKITPLYKKGDLSESTNNRLISILSQFDKILQKLIYNNWTIL